MIALSICYAALAVSYTVLAASTLYRHGAFRRAAHRLHVVAHFTLATVYVMVSWWTLVSHHG